MKQHYKIYLFLILLAFSLCNKAQGQSESLLKEYSAAKTDPEKGKAILRYVGNNNDSLRDKSLALLSYFNKQGDDVGTNYLKLLLNIQLNNTGQFTNALKESFLILERFEKRKDEYGRMWTFSLIANSY